ncbi:MAG: DUF1329 domain-containing protein [Gammaproteobacteria bacterium]|nr:DUF1329 domain-containing protein [Gammaproteobacteria bacterium]
MSTVNWRCAGLFVVGVFGALPSGAEELSAGTVIGPGNLAQRMDDSFAGHRIGDMLSEPMQMWIRDHNLTMRLAEPGDYRIPSHLIEATRANAGQARFNSETRLVEGWTAGIPFPPDQIDINDTQAGYKLAYNFFYTPAFRNDSAEFDSHTILIGANRGLEQTQKLINYQYVLQGRTSGGPLNLDEEVLKKQLVVVQHPYDVAGLGSFNIRYANGKQDNAWAYVKSVRRVRRISGNFWMDPVANLDLLGDDNGLIDASPSWYAGVKLLDIKHVLAVANTPGMVDPENFGERIDLDNPPHWNPINVDWEPREVFVLRIDYPEVHPYSYKTVYMEKEFPQNWLGEMYDKKGELWRIGLFMGIQMETENGEPAMAFSQVPVCDFQRLHCSQITVTALRLNNQELRAQDFSERNIEKVAKGQMFAF